MIIRKKSIRKLLKELSIEYNIKLHFTKSLPDSDGISRYWRNSISISLNQSAKSMLSAFFHEIGHIHCFKNGLWTSYHVNKPLEFLSKKEKIKYIKTAVKAEKWVDRWAEKEMKKHFPELKYYRGYSIETCESFKRDIKKILNYE